LRISSIKQFPAHEPFDGEGKERVEGELIELLRYEMKLLKEGEIDVVIKITGLYNELTKATPFTDL